MIKSKEPIRLRQRRTPSGLISLYLDIYLNGRRSYEYLKMYLVPEKTKADREKNRETLLLADAVRAKRVVELRNGQYGFRPRVASDTLFFDYYRSICEKRFGAESNGKWRVWSSCLHHLRIYEKRNITFADVTPEWVQGFREYLDKEAIAWDRDGIKKLTGKPLKSNSKLSYFSKLRACINQALDDGIVAENPLKKTVGFRREEGKRMYLTIDEVRRLTQAHCDHPRLKAAFLSSCLTGLRGCDVLALQWGEVYRHGDFTRIIFRQKKTTGLEYLDITDEAAMLMGVRGGSEDHVFTGIPSHTVRNSAIRIWVARAGIGKDITFHCARHTFATMMLDLGTDIYTVSKLLGHRELSTTQVYTRVLDKNKQAAVAAIPSILKREDIGKQEEAI